MDYISIKVHKTFEVKEFTVKQSLNIEILSVGTLIFPVYSPRPPKRPKPPRRMSVSAMNLIASMECPE